MSAEGNDSNDSGGRRREVTHPIDLEALKKLREESQMAALPTKPPLDEDDAFTLTTAPVDDDTVDRLRRETEEGEEQPAPDLLDRPLEEDGGMQAAPDLVDRPAPDDVPPAGVDYGALAEIDFGASAPAGGPTAPTTDAPIAPAPQPPPAQTAEPVDFSNLDPGSVAAPTGGPAAPAAAPGPASTARTVPATPVLTPLDQPGQPPVTVAPTSPEVPAEPTVRRPAAAPALPAQPVLDELDGWASSSSGDFSVDLDMDGLEDVAPTAPEAAPPPPVAPVVKRAACPVVAIDFGTSYSALAVLENDEPVLLPQPNGCIPSVVGFREDGYTLVGDDASPLRISDPKNVISSPKRLLGRKYREQEIQPYLASLGMAAMEGPDGGIVLSARGKTYTVEQICATLIYRLKEQAQQHLGTEVNEAVFTIPVSLDPHRIKALSRAAAIAGLRIVKVIEEPAAAALAYNRDASFRGLVAVYDFGGGTFDFSVLDVGQGLTVVATAGDTWLGGDDFDDVLAGAVANAFWRQRNIELRHQAVQWQRLLTVAERAKRQLSTAPSARLRLEKVANTADGALNLSVNITRQQFAHLAKDLVERSLDTCRDALELSDIKPSELNAVYMSGGTSLIPAVLDSVNRFFGQIPLISVPPDKAVILGAARYVGVLSQSRAVAPA